MEDAEFRPLVPFDDQSDSFVHGFEAGIISARMEAGEVEIKPEVPLHTANKTVLTRLADAACYDVEFTACDGIENEWVWAAFTKRPPVKGRHLRAV